MWAAPRDYERVGDKIVAALDQVAADTREILQSAQPRNVDGRGMASLEVGQKGGPRILAGAKEYAVGMLRGLLWQGGDMQSTQRDVGALGAVVIGKRVGTRSRGDVDLDDDQVRPVVQVQSLHMLVLKCHLVAVIQIAGKGSQAKRWKQ